MGNDFRKLKLPFIWYDILHLTDVLSQLPQYSKDHRLLELFNIIKQKETPDGFIPESIYQPWKEWDFGQKKVASDGMTFYISRIEKRLDFKPQTF